MIDTQLPPCPTCKLPAKREDTVGGFVNYACGNDQCEHFPATAYHSTEEEARNEWLRIATPPAQP